METYNSLRTVIPHVQLPSSPAGFHSRQFIRGWRFIGGICLPVGVVCSIKLWVRPPVDVLSFVLWEIWFITVIEEILLISILFYTKSIFILNFNITFLLFLIYIFFLV